MSVVLLPQPKQPPKRRRVKEQPEERPKVKLVKFWLSVLYDVIYLFSERFKALIVWAIVLLIVSLFIFYLTLLHEIAFPKFHAMHIKAHDAIRQEICEGYIPKKRRE
jgi:hypothetical protein